MSPKCCILAPNIKTIGKQNGLLPMSFRDFFLKMEEILKSAKHADTESRSKWTRLIRKAARGDHRHLLRPLSDRCLRGLRLAVCPRICRPGAHLWAPELSVENPFLRTASTLSTHGRGRNQPQLRLSATKHPTVTIWMPLTPKRQLRHDMTFLFAREGKCALYLFQATGPDLHCPIVLGKC